MSVSYTKPMLGEEIWRFDTANFSVVALACDEDMPPEDSFSEAEDVEFAQQGGSHWFCAVVEVRQTNEEGDETVLGRDVLGGCSYRSYREFVRERRGYFSDMVREALSKARDSRAQRVAQGCA